jgi:hypothetical protein
MVVYAPGALLIGALIFAVVTLTLGGRFKSRRSSIHRSGAQRPRRPIPAFEFTGFAGFALIILGVGITPFLAFTPILLLIGGMLVCVYVPYLLWQTR